MKKHPAQDNDPTPPKTKKFTTVKELLDDLCFIVYVEKNIEELIANRKARPLPKKGYKYKKDWYDTFYHTSKITASFFIDNMEDIWYKKSLLPANLRALISFIFNKSMNETVEFYQMQQAQEEKVEITK